MTAAFDTHPEIALSVPHQECCFNKRSKLPVPRHTQAEVAQSNITNVLFTVMIQVFLIYCDVCNTGQYHGCKSVAQAIKFFPAFTRVMVVTGWIGEKYASLFMT